MSESSATSTSSNVPLYLKDATRFREVVERFANLVHGTATRVLGDAVAAQDVAQRVFTDLLRHAPKIRSEGSLGAWLHRHTLFLALRERTANWRRTAREAEAHRRRHLEQTASSSPSWVPELDRALETLPDLDRRVLIARFYENLSLRETGDQLGLSEDAAQKRATRALEKLRLILSRRGFAHVPTTALTAAAGANASTPAHAAAWAGNAWAAAAPVSFSTASLTTFLVMNTKALLSGAAAATLVTSALFTPVLWQQRSELAELRQQLQSAPAPAEPPPPPKLGATASDKAEGAASARRQRWAEEQERLNSVSERAKSWQESVLQIQDAERKQRALEEMIAALMSDDPSDVLAALAAYGGTTQVEFDRASFRQAMLPLLKHEDALFRRDALRHLPTLPQEVGDIELITAMADDPDVGVREAVVSGLFWLNKGDLRHKEGETVLHILNREEHPTRSLINVMWGGAV